MYNHTNQMRCDFIRGKSQREMDDMLPLYAKTINTICPCDEDSFSSNFDNELAKHLSSSTKKTLANHRTEIAGALLGLYYEEDGEVFESDRNKKYLQDSDQPALFKDICFKHQFPTGVQKIATVQTKLDDGINFRPYPFILLVMQLAENQSIELTLVDIGYYILNSTDVLKGNATPEEVFSVIHNDKSHGIERHLIQPSNKAYSYIFQHIREQMNYLELANLIYIRDDGIVLLNHHENEAIRIFTEEYGKPLPFNFREYDLTSSEGRKEAHLAWRKYYGNLSMPSINGLFTTKALAIINAQTETISTQEDKSEDETETTVDIGDEGEELVFKYEKSRVRAYNVHLTNRVLSLGKTKGLGYDIQSVVAEPGPTAEFSKYIEVKTTKRVTAPAINDESWFDNFTITRNEYLAAAQHRNLYFIFRVYFTRAGVIIHVLGNIHQKADDGRIEIVPLTYRLDFSGKSVDSVISTKEIMEYINA